MAGAVSAKPQVINRTMMDTIYVPMTLHIVSQDNGGGYVHEPPDGPFCQLNSVLNRLLSSSTSKEISATFPIVITMTRQRSILSNDGDLRPQYFLTVTS